MPKEYLKCVESEMKAGKSHDDAQRICAISFYKRHGITPQQAEKKGMFEDNSFSEHKFLKNEDGTFNILQVPIFELGKHRGHIYDDKWMADALNNFDSLKADKKFLPRVIVGHTTKDSEKPAVGFLDNLKLQGKTVYADLTKLAQKTFDEIKNKAWPSRSVEVNPDKKKFTALALLGGSEPYFQFEPIDVKFEDDPDGQWIDFSDSDEKKNFIENFLGKMLEFFKESKSGDSEMTQEEISKLVKGEVDSMRAMMEKDFEKKFDDRYVEKFKEDFGVTPDEYKKSLAESEKAQFSEKKKNILTAAKKYLAPAIVDGFMEPIIDAVAGHENEVIKFAENEKGTIFNLIEKFTESLVKRFHDDTLLIDLAERSHFGGEDGNPNFGRHSESFAFADEAELEKYDQEINDYAEKHNISYEKAAEKVLANKK